MGRLRKILNLKFKILNSSFTLIETIIVVGITGLIIPVVFSIVFVILQQQAKIIRLQEVKRQGDFVLSSMKTTIRNNATEIYAASTLVEVDEKCDGIVNSQYGPDNGQAFFLKDRLGKWFNFYLDNGKISSGSASAPSDLTNDKVTVTSYSITCLRQSLYATPIISLSFTLTYNSASTRPEETAQLTYRTNIKLKSF